MRKLLFSLPFLVLAAPLAAQAGASADAQTDGAIVLPDFDTPAPPAEAALDGLAERLSDPATQDEIAATVSVLSEILLDLPLAPLIEPLADATADVADLPRRPVDPDLTLRRMSPRAGEVAQRVARDLPRTMDRMADASDGIAALIPALRDAFRQIEERVEGSLPRE
ncbi:MAG: hypothetical protein GW854_12660 [Erythrobacter sp.]|nr:hypothetical protein [Erythrobacter sp.]